jgi:hypothetical protein
MSSSPHPSSEKATGPDDLSAEEELSLDESLDAILSEVHEGVPILEQEPPAHLEPALEPPIAQVEVAAAAQGTDMIDDDSETPLPVIVDELPSYRAFADEVAPVEEHVEDHKEEVAAAPPASHEADEIFEAESLVESMTPAPVVEPVLEPAPATLAATDESPAFVTDAPSDEQILENIVLPPGSAPAPLVTGAAFLSTGTAPVASADALATSPGLPPAGAELEDDHTVISLPPVPEPSIPVPVFRSTWAQGPVAPAPEPPMAMLLTRQEGFTDKLLKLATAKVQTSVAGLAVVVIAASALGAGVVKMTSKPSPRAAIVAAAPEAAKAETAQAVPAAAPATAPAAAPAATPAPAIAEKPAPVRPAAHAKGHAPAPTHIALAAPAKPAAKHPAAPAPAAAKAKKPAGPAHSPEKGAGWVDPFGQ